jgi:hypothetical protein
MLSTKRGKELKINLFDNYTICYGSVNNDEPKSLYLNISSWAEPKSDEKLNYWRVIRDLDKKTRQLIHNKLTTNNTLFNRDKTIVDFDIKESGIKWGKRSFSSCEITLFLNNELSIHSNEIKIFFEDLINIIINEVFQKNNYFTFNKKKKEKKEFI